MLMLRHLRSLPSAAASAGRAALPFAPPPRLSLLRAHVRQRACSSAPPPPPPPPPPAARDRRAVGVWLSLLAGGVGGMVLLGGATRLTRSGLSIVEWRLAGEPLPWPSDVAGWDAAWAAYRASPEGGYNAHISRGEFQFI